MDSKNYYNHRAPMQWKGSFGSKFHLPASHIDPILKKNACCSFLLKESNYRPDRILMGSTVNILLKLWVCKLSFLKRHPSIQRSKILKHCALLQWKEKKLLPVGSPRLSDWPNTGRIMIPNSRLSMESNCRPQFDYLSWSCWNLVKF
jgi:hypothetical protein